MTTPIAYESTSIAVQNAFIRKVYAWMTGGLLLTALFSALTISSPAAIQIIFGNRLVFYGLLFGELGLVLFLSARIQNLSSSTATFMFLAYSALNGVTLSAVFLAYTRSSIALTFVVTAGMFGAMAVYGSITRRDLTGVGSFAIMGLFGIIIVSLANLFFRSPAVSWVTSAIGVIVFTLLTAYDTQKLKAIAAGGFEGQGEEKKNAIMGALALYLDFVNLTLNLLRLMGNRR